MAKRSTRPVRAQAPIHVVIIDGYDECDMYAEALRSYGIVVTTAESARDGIRLLESAQPDVVVQGLVFADLAGIELTQRIRAIPHLRRTPIAAVSGFTDRRTLDAAHEAGIDCVLLKPCLPERLLREIETLLAASRAQGRAEGRDAARGRRRL
jgi:two-component system, cell cycle response regulator DivK